jgi:hypothetical protein
VRRLFLINGLARLKSYTRLVGRAAFVKAQGGAFEEDFMGSIWSEGLGFAEQGALKKYDNIRSLLQAIENNPARTHTFQAGEALKAMLKKSVLGLDVLNATNAEKLNAVLANPAVRGKIARMANADSAALPTIMRSIAGDLTRLPVEIEKAPEGVTSRADATGTSPAKQPAAHHPPYASLSSSGLSSPATAGGTATPASQQVAMAASSPNRSWRPPSP